MFEIDTTSMILTVDADLPLFEIERKLKEEGYTLGYFHPPNNRIFLEEAFSEAAANLYRLYYGELRDLCVSLTLEDHRGEVIKTRRVPRHATGPCWKNLLWGTQRKWGLIYLIDLKIFHPPTAFLHTLFPLASEEESFEIEREMRKKELLPRAFGRFSRASLRPLLKSLKGEIFLLVEWAGSHDEVREVIYQLEHLFGRKWEYQVFETAEHKSKLSRLLKQALPVSGWGGEKFISPDANVLEFEREILESLV